MADAMTPPLGHQGEALGRRIRHRRRSLAGPLHREPLVRRKKTALHNPFPVTKDRFTGRTRDARPYGEDGIIALRCETRKKWEMMPVWHYRAQKTCDIFFRRGTFRGWRPSNILDMALLT